MSARLTSIFLAVLLAVLQVNPARGGELAQESYQFWQPRAVSDKSDPRVVRAEAVFKRVLAAADHSDARFPRLLVLSKDHQDPYAAAIPDGTVLLSLTAIDACFAGVSPAKGDARLAFVLGHELSHLARNDFWHQAAYRSLRQFAAGGKELKNVADVILKSGDLGKGNSQEVAKAKELQADSYGIVYMAMAGYDPHAVVDRDGVNFFQQYVSQITGQLAYRDDTHPTPAERAEFLRVQLSKVADEVDLFQVGVRYYQQGRYQDAIGYLDRFRERFPSREVFNDLGLCYYQLALERLSQCDQALSLRFKLPVLIDTDTLALAVRGGRGDCLQDETFRSLIEQAVKQLELASAKDARYLPSRLNLAAARIMAGEYTAALAAAEDALKIRPGDLDALGLKGVALYLFGGANGVDTSEQALALLKGSSPDSAPHAAALYNMAAIETERGKSAEAGRYLEAFLKQEGEGIYAAAARRSLGRSPLPAPRPSGASAPVSPVALGDLGESTAASLKGMTRTVFMLGRNEADLYRGKGMLAVVDTDGASGAEVVDLVQAEQHPALPLTAFLKRYGAPRREIPVPGGSVLVYDGFVGDLKEGEVRTLTFFNSGSF